MIEIKNVKVNEVVEKFFENNTITTSDGPREFMCLVEFTDGTIGGMIESNTYQSISAITIGKSGNLRATSGSIGKLIVGSDFHLYNKSASLSTSIKHVYWSDGIMETIRTFQ